MYCIIRTQNSIAAVFSLTVMLTAFSVVTAQTPDDLFSSNAVQPVADNAPPAAGEYDPFLLQKQTAPPLVPTLEPHSEAALLPSSSAAQDDRTQYSAAAGTVDYEPIRQLAEQPSKLAVAKPLGPWNGPFQNRQKKQDLEQTIIQQVGYASSPPLPMSNEPQFDWEKDEEKGFDWSVLDPINLTTKFRDWAGLGPDEDKAKAALQKGREILLANPGLQDKKKNREAATLFSDAAKRFPDSLIEEDALHLAGECYFFADDYPKAMTMYQKLLIKYQHSKHVDIDVRRLFKIARYWESESKRQASGFNFSDKSLPQYDTFGFAKKCYETVFINDPNGPVSDDAVMALATAYLERGKYQGDDNYNQAAYYYCYLRENFPLSKHLAKAHENELYARTRAYMGAEHPSKSLEEAGKLAEITLRQFGSELDSESKNEIVELKEGVLVKEAERLWMQGQFYDVKKYRYGSAKICYERIIREYPQTEFAEKARRRIAAIKDLPEVPPIVSLPHNPFKKASQ
ncbi:MAG: outer membrane protein assembly factor BamD [Planctomycetaceae bacterium]|jgi:outer membrane protein assembly factor BamD (BamD/ComL family)|nr:outer membrane protein assembly factor BamD [Planctomycetaceae bacterium]